MCVPFPCVPRVPSPLVTCILRNPSPTTPPRTLVTSVPHTPTRFAPPHAPPLGQKTAPPLHRHLYFLMRSPSSTPPPPFPTPLFPLALRTPASHPPTPSLLSNHRTIQTAKILTLRPSGPNRPGPIRTGPNRTGPIRTGPNRTVPNQSEPLLCTITPSPILADSGATHVLLRESVLPSLAHLMRPATLPPMPFTLPNGSLLTAQSGGHLHFPRLPFPVPFWSAPDSVLSHSLLAISPLLQTFGSCLLTPTSLSIFAPGDPTPVLVG